MPQFFVQLTPAIERACAESLVLTTTERLRRNLVRAFNLRQQQLGRQAWPTPRIQTLDGHLAGCHARLRLETADLPALLSPEAVYQRWCATAPPDAVRLVPVAQEAWQLCRQWAVPLDAAHFAATENGRIFLDWARRFERRLDDENAITSADLPRITGLASGAAELCCLAFEHLPTAYAAWLDRQQRRGTRVVHLNPPPGPTADAHRSAFATPAEELAGVAQWLWDLLSAPSDDLNVGIVVPDLAARQTSVLRQLTAQLDPLLEQGTDGLIDLGGGLPLGEQPVWRAAADWLTLCCAELDTDRALACVASRYLSLPRPTIRVERLPPELDLRTLSRLADQPELTNLRRRLGEPGPRSLAGWLATFQDILSAAGWNGRGIGSVQYQAQREIEGRLDALARSADPRIVTAREALQLISHYLATVTFAPERSPAPVQIMGYLETTGLRFSHLWILGLDDGSWPQPLRLNPFIPVATRRRFGIPRSTPEEEAVFARDRLSSWRTSTGELIASHAHHAGESALRPSPLIRDLPEVSALLARPPRAHPFFQHRHDQLESLADFRGPPIEPGALSGGTGRLRDQAVCPFRGFAIHRLGIPEQRPPHGLPDALDRGVLIHEALHRLYDTASRAGTQPADLHEPAFAEAAAQALARHYGRFPAPFCERERLRLAALLAAWNVLEIDRGEQRIEALERSVDAQFGGIGLRLRVDRLDRQDGSLLVIDYKSGRVAHRLTGDRLLDPQLPLYALSDDAVTGVLYAEVNQERPRLRGISEQPVPSAILDDPAGGSWQSQRAAWQRQIDELTAEILEGLGTVMPHDARACQSCHLKPFCRVEQSSAEDVP